MILCLGVAVVVLEGRSGGGSGKTCGGERRILTHRSMPVPEGLAGMRVDAAAGKAFSVSIGSTLVIGHRKPSHP